MPPESMKAETEYVVLTKPQPIANGTTGNANAWTVVKTVQARDAQTAIKQVADTKATALYVAVPARSWQPVKVTPKVETTLVLEEAK